MIKATKGPYLRDNNTHDFFSEDIIWTPLMAFLVFHMSRAWCFVVEKSALWNWASFGAKSAIDDSLDALCVVSISM